MGVCMSFILPYKSLENQESRTDVKIQTNHAVLSRKKMFDWENCVPPDENLEKKTFDRCTNKFLPTAWIIYISEYIQWII